MEATAGNTGSACRSWPRAWVSPRLRLARKDVGRQARRPRRRRGRGDRHGHAAVLARELPERRSAAGRGTRWFLTDQFANPANPWRTSGTTGPVILEQCGGRVGAFVQARAGTQRHRDHRVGRGLKAHCPGYARVIVADPVGSRLGAPGRPLHPDHDASYLVEGSAAASFPRCVFLSVVDAAERVGDDESFAVARRLIREEGLLVGGSIGTPSAARCG
ncbi:MAG: pyridoxal-phosphate dependent enzyme [Isosphaeraceae bacterium]